jgi:DNA-binding MarR family transcriptional regulator
MSQPHIAFRNRQLAPIPGETDVPGAPAHLPPQTTLLGELLLRAAECLTALLQSPTAQAGLNESRYHVLAVLSRTISTACSQTELASHLLQSESNLSTLLERMRRDGLISRVRSETDRRKALIKLTPAGRDAVAHAEQARTRATAKLLHSFGAQCEAALGEALSLLVDRLENALGVTPHGASPLPAAGASSRPELDWPPAGDERPGRPALSGVTALNPGEPTR